MKRRVEHKKAYLWLAPVALLAMGGCGEHIGTMQSISADKQEAQTTKTFTAELRPLNASILSSEGDARVEAGEGSLDVRIEMRNVTESSHRQTLISGSCPDASLDTNGDGIIDGTEYSVGDSAVWDLDDSLEDTAGESNYPVGDAAGTYVYSESLSQMAEGVSAPDVSSGTYSIVVFGVDDETELPETVSGERSAIPMACGTLQEEAADEPQDDEGQMPDDDQGQQDQGQHDQVQQTQHQQQQQHQQVQQTQQSQGQKNVMIPELE